MADDAVPGNWRMGLAAVSTAAGLTLGLWGALAENPFSRWGGDAGLAASVNDAVITSDDVILAVEAVASGKRNELTDADRARILARLIDEELLIQRGVEIGLVDSDNTVRKAIANAMINSVLADAAGEMPSESDLRRVYDANPALFSGAGRYQVELLFLRDGPDMASRENAVAQRLNNGEEFGVVARDAGDPMTIPVPQAPLPLAKLREYAGPSVAAAAARLAEGETAGPVTTPGGVAFVHLQAREPGDVRPFAEVRALVAAEYARRRDDEALRAYLDWLWSRAEIDLADGFTTPPAGER